jgi:lipopolysaccharide transport system ATP-binding protein
MAPPVISVENLSKRYLVGHRAERTMDERFPNLRDVLARHLRNGVRKAADVVRGRQVVQGDAIEEFWALADVSFEVQEGEVLGIIGRNGAGKSTLLKILSRITEPTSGRVTLRGRVASLLEVGTGFHPELSGRENIYLNGAVLGMSRAEIRKKFDEIIAFAEIEKFLDTPVKRYSSGMYVRLAFAVAAHLEPEILIVDEVLAVGDTEFQKKCLGKMDEVSRRQGRTVLFVSHNMGSIQRLCSRVMALSLGRVVILSDDVSGSVRSFTSLNNESLAGFWTNDGSQYVNDIFVPIALKVTKSQNPENRITGPDACLTIEIIGDILKIHPALSIAFSVYLADGQRLCSSSVHDGEEGQSRRLSVGRHMFRAELPSGLLNEADYEIELIAMLHNRFYIIAPGSGPRVRFANSMSYSSFFWDKRRDGLTAPQINWEVTTYVNNDAHSMSTLLIDH